MSSPKQVPFYEIFPFCAGNGKLSSDYTGARVVSATVDKTRMTMDLMLSLTEPVPPVEIGVIEELIAREFGLSSVVVTALQARDSVKADADSSPAITAAKRRRGARPPRALSTGAVIMGRRIKQSATPMGDVHIELGKVVITGEVCDIKSKFIEKNKAWILSFDMTDFTGAIHVSRFLSDENAQKIVDKIQPGMWLTVSGMLILSRYESDLTLEPVNIIVAEKPIRLDNAEEKRVELHLHTKMSAMDAVADTAGVIRRAAEWGHHAIAITDHGVIHSFPEAAGAVKAVGDGIKVIYGVEGYYVNDVEPNTAVFGSCYPDDAADDPPCRGSVNSTHDPLSRPHGESVVFDIETTGLSACDNAIFEIGAILVKHGKEQGRFHTFADPGAPIPADITKLTGISDADIASAPSQYDAISAFLQFAGGRPLVAHNADFDVGFVTETCDRHGIPYHPYYIDTLALSRALLPKLKNHRLDTVARNLGYADFNHHRAEADAEATAYIWDILVKMLNDAGIKDIRAVNDYLAKLRDEKRDNPDKKKNRTRFRHIILLAKTQIGLKNLYKLVTKSHLEYFNNFPIIYKSVLTEYRDGLLIGSACEAGEVFLAVTERRSKLELHRLAGFYDYLEIQPVCNNMFMLYREKQRASSVEDLRSLNRRIVELGKEMAKPVAATGDVHFLDPEHEVFRQILLMSRGFDSAYEQLPVYLKTTDEMLEEINYLGKETAYDVVVRTPRMIAEMCDVVHPLPPEKELFLPKLEGSAEDLQKRVSDSLAEKYGENPPEIIVKRVRDELRDILDRGYDVIYMAAQKLVADSLAHGYLVGSRGSVGSSVVAYLAGITEVNALPAHYRCPSCRNCDFQAGAGWGCGADMPDMDCPACGVPYIKDGFNIPFETFLGFDGDKVPDIDLNFSGEFKAKAHRFTNELFGPDNVFRAGTIGTIKEKTAYGYVMKYLEAIKKNVTKAEENRLARGCAGVRKTTGQHPGGLVIIPQDKEITDFCPAQHPADDSDKGIITTHFDYHRMEGNLIKLDELGHDDPTMIKMLEDLTGIDAREIKLGDPGTMAIFTSPLPLGLPDDDEIIGATGSIGIPEFGTPLTRQMLCDTQPEKFDTLVRLSGFAHGELVWIDNAKDLIMTGKATVSDTIGCRDDIMLFLISRGMDDRYAFKISESVRKGHALPDGAEDEMINYDVPGWYIESCKKIKYLFPKAHAVAYVIMAFRIAWFKVNKPLEFYSAHFFRRSQNNAFDAEYMTKGIEIARIKIHEFKNIPDIKDTKEEELLITLEACYEFYLRGFEFTRIDFYESDPVKFLITDDNKLRPPFVSISGVGEAAAFDIAESRNGREFISIDEVSAACSKVSRTCLDQLKALGAMRDLPESSQMSLF